MKRSQRYLLVATALVVVCLLIFSQRLRQTDDSDTPLPTAADISSPSSQAPTKPKITVIVIWSIHDSKAPVYLPYFFQSVEANPDVDLLFVAVDRAGVGCKSHSSSPNVQELCLTENQYYGLHADFLCSRWKCSSSERERLMMVLKREAPKDKNNSFFRILRNGIFERFISSDTTIWGWCDPDTFWGNFKRTFPWDLASDGTFDILAPASQPVFSNHRLLYTRGHMAFFKHSPDVLDNMLSYPKFSSLKAFLDSPATAVDAEESEFSHYFFSENEAFTFVFFEAMVDSWDTIILASGRSGGVFFTPVKLGKLSAGQRQQLAKVIRSERTKSIGPSLTDEGVEQEATVYKDGFHFPADLWFNRKWATWIETGWTVPEEREQKAYFMRRESHGPIVQRREPRERYLRGYEGGWVDECLYKHWQEEKREAPWFRQLPSHLNAGETLVQDGGEYAEVWNADGETVLVVETMT